MREARQTVTSQEAKFLLRFDPIYALRVARMMLRFPGVALRVPSGRVGLLTELERRILSEYSRKRVDAKHFDGFTIFLNSNDKDVSPRVAVLGWIEGGTTELFIRLLRPDSVVFDIGANIGWFTLQAACRAGRRGRVVAFEPDPTNFSFLSKSVTSNAFGNVELLRLSVSNFEGTAPLHLAAGGHAGHHSLKRPENGGSIQVSCQTLDKVAEMLNVGRIDILKADVEGSEPEVMEGAHRLMSESRIRNIIMEWNYDVWNPCQSLLGALREMYTFYEIADLFPFPLLRRIRSDSDMSRIEKNVYLKLKEGPTSPASRKELVPEHER